jgi:amidase
MADPLLLPVRDQIALLSGGNLSAVELTTAALRRIGRLNPAINAVITLDADAALEAAAASDARIRAGAARPLEGLPATLKDAFDTAGIAT